jgi:hypothetical protein
MIARKIYRKWIGEESEVSDFKRFGFGAFEGKIGNAQGVKINVFVKEKRKKRLWQLISEAKYVMM